MWYKFNIETNEWFFGNGVYFPNGDILKDNHEDTIDGWFWSDKVPSEYLEYIEYIEYRSM
jgi:hypothetical protein